MTDLIGVHHVDNRTELYVTREGNEVQLRIWFFKGNEWRPSHDAVRVPMRGFGEFVEVLRRALEAIGRGSHDVGLFETASARGARAVLAHRSPPRV